MTLTYQMVIINLFTSIILILCYLFYRYVYPKKKIHYLTLVFIISLLPLLSLLRPGSYESGDLSLHVTRSMSFYNVLSKELTIPTWSPELNLGYGDAYFQFIYLTPYLAISIFHFLGLSFLASVKLLIAISYICSGVFFYAFSRKHFSDFSSFVGTIFYLFAPYHLIDMHLRASIAETLAISLIPLLFLLIHKFYKRQNWINFLTLAIIISIFILSHLAIFISTLPFALIYFLILNKKNIKKQKVFLLFIFSFFLGLTYSIFYWLPILAENKYIYQSLQIDKISLVPIKELLYSPWKFGFLFQGHGGEIRFLIGYPQLIALIIITVLIIKNRIKPKDKIITNFAFIGFLITIFMVTNLSKFFWEIIPFIKNFQFSYRFLAINSFFMSLLLSIIASNLKLKKMIILLCFIAIFSTIPNWGNRKNLPAVNDLFLKNTLSYYKTVTGNAEPTTPIWVNYKIDNFYKRPKKEIETIKGNTQIKIIKNSPYGIEFLASNINPSIIKINRFYFPGWELRINNKIVKTEYQSKNYPGIMIFKLNKGLYLGEIKYTKTYIRKISLLITQLFIIFTIFLSLYLSIKKTLFLIQNKLSYKLK